ncbi:hypothetical protein Tco_1285112 [Tanacetum coccineum]
MLKSMAFRNGEYEMENAERLRLEQRHRQKAGTCFFFSRLYCFIPLTLASVANLQINKISDFEMWVSDFIACRCYNESGGVTGDYYAWINLETTPFTFHERNKFRVTGCDDFAVITGINGGDFFSGCLGLCSRAKDVPSGYCSRTGCCQTSIPKRLKFYNCTLLTLRNHTRVPSFNHCGFAFLDDEESF